MASIHLDEFAKNGKAILFENIRGCNYKAVSNLFGSLSRSRLMFSDSLQIVKDLIEIKNESLFAFKNPVKAFFIAINAFLLYQKGKV